MECVYLTPLTQLQAAALHIIYVWMRPSPAATRACRLREMLDEYASGVEAHASVVAQLQGQVHEEQAARMASEAALACERQRRAEAELEAQEARARVAEAEAAAAAASQSSAAPQPSTSFSPPRTGVDVRPCPLPMPSEPLVLRSPTRSVAKAQPEAGATLTTPQRPPPAPALHAHTCQEEQPQPGAAAGSLLSPGAAGAPRRPSIQEVLDRARAKRSLAAAACATAAAATSSPAVKGAPPSLVQPCGKEHGEACSSPAVQLGKVGGLVPGPASATQLLRSLATGIAMGLGDTGAEGCDVGPGDSCASAAAGLGDGVVVISAAGLFPAQHS